MGLLKIEFVTFDLIEFYGKEEEKNFFFFNLHYGDKDPPNLCAITVLFHPLRPIAHMQ